MRRFVIAAALCAALPTLAVAASPTPATIRVDTTTREIASQTAVRSARAYTDDAGVTHPLPANTALGQLVALGVRRHLVVRILTFSFGPEVYRIGSVGSPTLANWQFAVNGAVPLFGANHVTLRPGDRVAWWYVKNFATQWFVTPLDLVVVSHHHGRIVFLVRRTINNKNGTGALKGAKGAILTVNHHHYLVGQSGRVIVTLAKHAAFRAAATQTGAIPSETLTGRV